MAVMKEIDKWVGSRLTGVPTRSKPPGPILLAFVTVAVIVWVCVDRNWWPSPFGSYAWLDPLLAAIVCVLVFLVTGLIWAIRTLYVLGRDQRWSWWVVPAPAVVLAGLAFLALMPSTSLLDVRSEFDAIAVDLHDNPGVWRERFEIGPFDIRSAHSSPSGEVYFTDNASIFNTTIGWVYSPDAEPSGLTTVTHLDGPWYEYTSVWR
ncbi:putative uncharacterized protein [Rhodococcus sp. AW25M09]|uniref:hypothetical protein n=1 Tax=Rhodococcus sp. AW25M09 TaxID=1268303 RepID=UPI0002ACE6CD|nr:hypothetical protein [Rhodococcus sp. AW25M09]CCQ14622.1 putative uncharacterized protein [Rhodococcus sp. AW25M09]